MRGRGAVETSTIDAKHARAQLAMLLAKARPEKLAGFTVDSLAAMNRTPRREIEAMLDEARQGRLAHG